MAKLKESTSLKEIVEINPRDMNVKRKKKERKKTSKNKLSQCWKMGLISYVISHLHILQPTDMCLEIHKLSLRTAHFTDGIYNTEYQGSQKD